MGEVMPGKLVQLRPGFGATRAGVVDALGAARGAGIRSRPDQLNGDRGSRGVLEAGDLVERPSGLR